MQKVSAADNCIGPLGNASTYPQKAAPASKPMFWAKVKRGPSVGLNSFTIGVSSRLVVI